jgi:DNA-binding NarL/FixJ family response regulator
MALALFAHLKLEDVTMTILVHVACDDEIYRAVIAEYLHHQSDMEVVGASAEGQIGAAAIEFAGPDVVVLGIPPDGNVAKHAPKCRQVMESGAAVVAFCMTEQQAAEYQQLGIEHVIVSDEPARELSQAVRLAFAESSALVRNHEARGLTPLQRRH